MGQRSREEPEETEEQIIPIVRHGTTVGGEKSRRNRRTKEIADWHTLGMCHVTSAIIRFSLYGAKTKKRPKEERGRPQEMLPVDGRQIENDRERRLLKLKKKKRSRRLIN
ncbi:hypothetical protein AVEN_81087-1 [Araneus ventricosus]|uniref:Uncharacterized protein n=1 Tax=Araneus ventricosus TaxID=182803 RepID=A0A4Y2JRK6_ARAVE|nr:hypothetical protein AVEN_81087-1 [Araneus ventricosus]